MGKGNLNIDYLAEVYFTPIYLSQKKKNALVKNT